MLRKFSNLLRPTPAGLYCPPGDFYIDPVRPVARAVITHGHSDHARSGHDTVVATPETLAIMTARYGADFTSHRESLAYGDNLSRNGVMVTLLPAGHVLGSAQAVISWNGITIAVSGDYKRRRDPTCAPFEPPVCDVFVSEATFGLPVFVHPPDSEEIAARLAKQALAALGGVAVEEIEEIWHAQSPPYGDLFAWLEKRSDKPSVQAPARFRPVMLAQAINEEKDFVSLDPANYAAEWKWDGIRVQAAHEGNEKRLWSRTGDDIGKSFPDLLAAMDFEGVIDGELLVRSTNGVAPFSELQQRLNRKKVDAALQKKYPVFVRAYDLLMQGKNDLRSLPFTERRRLLQTFIGRLPHSHFDLSPLQSFASWDALQDLRANPPAGDPSFAEGLMLKRWDSIYEPGRPKGPWFKWKRAPRLIDAVLMYAQHGHGRRSGFYSDFTFGVWKTDTNGEKHLTPVGKAYFGFTDEELTQLDKFVRDHTVERYGPVRSVKATWEFGLVLEVAFEGIAVSGRHKSGVAMRFPRISRIRWDKPAREADELTTLERLLDK